MSQTGTEFSGQVVVVTGAAGALGQAVAAHFRERGARVAHLDYSDALLEQAFAAVPLRAQHLFKAVDLTSREATAQCINAVAGEAGAVQVLANIAGGFVMGEAVHETSDKTWDFLFNLNTRSIIHTAAAVVPLMLAQGGGKIINISAGAAHHGVANMGAYVASKSSVLRLTESMALELRERGINVNCILPGTIDTARNRSDMPGADYSKWVAPAELAKVVGFLASSQSNAVHGAGIPVVGLG